MLDPLLAGRQGICLKTSKLLLQMSVWSEIRAVLAETELATSSLVFKNEMEEASYE